MEGIELGFGGSSEGLELGLGQTAECDDMDATDHPKPPKGRSIAHNVLTDGSAVFLSFGIEIGGEYAGIIKLSAELVRMKLVAGRGVAQDRLEEVARVETFDSYAKPDCDIWDQRCIDIHQIHPNDECIVSANNIDHVWGQFKTRLNCHVGISETLFFLLGMGKPVISSGCERSRRHRSHIYPFHPRYSSLLIRTTSSPASSCVPFTNRSPNLRGMILAACGSTSRAKT